MLLAQNNKVDMYSAIPYDLNRAKYMNFTKNSIFKYKASFVKNKNDKTNYTNLDKVLVGKTIAIVKSSSLGSYVKSKYPNVKYIEVFKTKDGFDKLKNKSVDLFAINSATANYMINNKGYDNLEISSKLEFEFELKIAISKSMPTETLSIIDKTLQNIDKTEIDIIYDKWMKPVLIKKETDWLVVTYIIVAVSLLLLFLMNRHYIIKRQALLLEKKVQEKTKK